MNVTDSKNNSSTKSKIVMEKPDEKRGDATLLTFVTSSAEKEQSDSPMNRNSDSGNVINKNVEGSERHQPNSRTRRSSWDYGQVFGPNTHETRMPTRHHANAGEWMHPLNPYLVSFVAETNYDTSANVNRTVAFGSIRGPWFPKYPCLPSPYRFNAASSVTPSATCRSGSAPQWQRIDGDASQTAWSVSPVAPQHFSSLTLLPAAAPRLPSFSDCFASACSHPIPVSRAPVQAGFVATSTDRSSAFVSHQSSMANCHQFQNSRISNGADRLPLTYFPPSYTSFYVDTPPPTYSGLIVNPITATPYPTKPLNSPPPAYSPCSNDPTCPPYAFLPVDSTDAASYPSYSPNPLAKSSSPAFSGYSIATAPNSGSSPINYCEQRGVDSLPNTTSPTSASSRIATSADCLRTSTNAGPPVVRPPIVDDNLFVFEDPLFSDVWRPQPFEIVAMKRKRKSDSSSSDGSDGSIQS